MVMTLPGSAVPVRVGVVSLVVLSFTSPVTGSASSLIAVITGTAGRISGESGTSKVVVGLALPAASVANSVSVAGSSWAGERAMEKMPPVATPVPMILPPESRTVTVVPSSAVPVSGVPSAAMVILVGVAGSSVSTVTLRSPELAEVFPAASLAATEKVCGPSASAGSAVQDHVPFG